MLQLCDQTTRQLLDLFNQNRQDQFINQKNIYKVLKFRSHFGDSEALTFLENNPTPPINSNHSNSSPSVNSNSNCSSDTENKVPTTTVYYYYFLFYLFINLFLFYFISYLQLIYSY
jgi:hypothetical protein